MVLNQVGGNADSVAEMTLGLMLSVLRRIPESDRRLRSSERGFSREDLMGRELRGRTLGLVGMSEIGRRTAALGRAFGMRVLGFDPALTPRNSRGAAPKRCHSTICFYSPTSFHFTARATPTR
jgi:D-3-phosphoglycerate dehydrogenase